MNLNICRLKRSCVSVYHQKFGEKEKKKEMDDKHDCKTISKYDTWYLEIWISILNSNLKRFRFNLTRKSEKIEDDDAGILGFIKEAGKWVV